MSGDYSREALLQFLEYLSEKGLVNKNTIVARKAASNKMLSILDEKEASDLRAVDINEVATRFANLLGSNYTPDSLQVYRSRANRSLLDFLRFKANPANFKISASASKAKSPSMSAGSTTPASGTGKPPNQTSEIAGTPGAVETLNIPIALRPTCIIQLNGIPVDLTASEAKKIANIVIAMSSDGSE